MSTRNALRASLAVVPNTLSETIAALRQQLSDQMTIAANAWNSGDFELCAKAAMSASSAAAALQENIELQSSRMRITVADASTETLLAVVGDRAATETDVPGLVAALHKKLSKKEPARGRA